MQAMLKCEKKNRFSKLYADQKNMGKLRIVVSETSGLESMKWQVLPVIYSEYLSFEKITLLNRRVGIWVICLAGLIF